MQNEEKTAELNEQYSRIKDLQATISASDLAALEYVKSLPGFKAAYPERGWRTFPPRRRRRRNCPGRRPRSRTASNGQTLSDNGLTPERSSITMAVATRSSRATSRRSTGGPRTSRRCTGISAAGRKSGRSLSSRPGHTMPIQRARRSRTRGSTTSRSSMQTSIPPRPIRKGGSCNPNPASR